MNTIRVTGPLPRLIPKRAAASTAAPRYRLRKYGNPEKNRWPQKALSNVGGSPNQPATTTWSSANG